MALHRVLQKLRKTEQLAESIDDVIEQIVRENSEYLIKLLQQQLSQGDDSKNNPVTLFGKPVYAISTIKKKQRYGRNSIARETRWITNYMSGNFYRKIEIIVSGGNFGFISSVKYYPTIIGRSGEVIMRLNRSNIELFKKEILLPQLKLRLNV